MTYLIRTSCNHSENIGFWIPWLVILLIVPPVSGQESALTGTITGTVADEDGPLVGAQVWVAGSDQGDVSDSLGVYRIETLQPGSYRIIFSYIGYKREERGPVGLFQGETRIIDVRMEQLPIVLEAIMVTPKEDRFEPTGLTARLSTRMIQEAPGAAQDIFLVLQTLPGVSSAGDDSKLYVRGGKPEENLVVYDGATISNPFHFDFIGGGFYTIFNSSQVERVEFYSGGYPARYGDRLAAVMVIENREGSREKRGYELSLSMADMKVLAEFPISDKVTTIMAVRRSYFDLLLGQSGFGGKYDLLPYFYDLNSRTDIFLSDKHRLSLNALYSREKMSGEFDEPHWIGTHTWSTENWTMGMRLRSLISPRMSSDLNLYWSEGYNQASHADGVGTENTRRGEVALKEDIGLSLVNHEIHTGFWIVQDRGDMEIELPVDLAYNFEALFFTSKGSASKWAAYVEDTWKANSWLSMNLGFRGDHIVASSETIISPRLNMVITPFSDFQFTVNYGLFTQAPPAYELENNPNLRSRRSQSWGLGVNGKVRETLYWSMEAYQKKLSRLMTVDFEGRFTDEGSGDVKGVELYLQKKTGDRFIGWVSYTWSVANRREGTAREKTAFDYDQTHMVSAVGQFRPSDLWKISTRFRYATGNPYTPALGGLFDPGTQRYFPQVGDRNSERYPAYHRLDIRVSRSFPDVMEGLTVYVETINTYDRDNVIYYVWNEDFSDTRNFTVFPFLPVLGIDLAL